MRQDQVCEGGHVEEVAVDVEELAEEGLDAVEVDFGVKVKPFEVYVDNVEVLIGLVNFLFFVVDDSIGCSCSAYLFVAAALVHFVDSLVGGLG